MRKLIRKWIPAEYRLRTKLILNKWQARKYRSPLGWAQTSGIRLDIPAQIKICQHIKTTERSENKIHNMKLAIERLEQVTLFPNQAFSFWHCVGRPLASRGYQSGRNLINGVLTEDIGGGLCQLAGIIYHTALLSGLDVLERHSHSVDIYREDDRYTPLGADATVVYGYKDLKLINPHSFTIQLSFKLEPGQLCCSILSESGLPTNQIEFNRKDLGDKWEVNTVRIDTNGNKQALYISTYNKMHKA
ncbi:MAG: VanW family protein [Chitinophagales bacterium]|nr:VanW family protein [Chitinophagales bacterium]